MFLKSIDLFGFKSFADRSRIEFQDGVSALLGPNGCGKSNVVDAIKWVLGEQSTKTLRAERMEDVIFNGTENRKALNVAEVTLTLSNDDSILPIDFQEISIKRRIYRSGEGEYYLNGTPIKLRELRELFFDTGIGKSSYSIMEQGKIDQILSNKPEERRYIFEEAAGITKYKMKGAEAEKKLERTEENMRQVESILSEVKRSYETLRVQAEKTEVYRELKNHIFEVELDLLLLRLKALVDDQDAKEKRLSDRNRQRDEIKAKIDTVNKSLEASLDQVNSMESTLIESQKKLYGLDLERTNKQNQINLLLERRGELEAQIESAKGREKNLSEKIASLAGQVTEREAALGEARSRITEIERNIETFEQSIAAANGRIVQNEKAISDREREIRELEHRQEGLQEQLRAITDDIVSQLDARLKETGYSLQARKGAEEAIATTLSSLRIHIDGKVKILEDALRVETDDGRLVEQAASGLREALEGIARLTGLFDGYRKAVPTFLDEFLAPEGIITRKRELDDRMQENRNGVAQRRSAAASLREENRTLAAKVDEYRKTLEELRVNRAQMHAQIVAIEEAITLLRREAKEHEGRHAEITEEIATCTARLTEIGGQVAGLEAERKRINEDEGRLRAELSRLESGISERNRELLKKEESLKEARASLERIHGHIEQLQIELAAVKTEVRTLYDNFQENHSRDLTEFEPRMLEIKELPKDLRTRQGELRDKEKALGQVNLMAPEEFAEVKARYEFLNTQLDDLKKAKDDLRKITSEIKTESTELFLETYERIRKNFHSMFRRLFGGGRAELRLLDPDNLLDSGIEIYAQPPGKKLESIALLSGGERSMTAVALLFATYMVRPSPFCILDEIDAALDEENVGRFVNLLMEFGGSSQFIVITHNKKTVTGAKTLLGVTMEESGVSKIIAVRIGDARETVEAGS